MYSILSLYPIYLKNILDENICWYKNIEMRNESTNVIFDNTYMLAYFDNIPKSG